MGKLKEFLAQLKFGKKGKRRNEAGQGQELTNPATPNQPNGDNSNDKSNKSKLSSLKLLKKLLDEITKLQAKNSKSTKGQVAENALLKTALDEMAAKLETLIEQVEVGQQIDEQQRDAIHELGKQLKQLEQQNQELKNGKEKAWWRNFVESAALMVAGGGIGGGIVACCYAHPLVGLGVVLGGAAGYAVAMLIVRLCKL